VEWEGRIKEEPYAWWAGLRLGETSAGARSLPSLKSVFGDEEWRVGAVRERGRDVDVEGLRTRAGSAPASEVNRVGGSGELKGKGKRGAEEEERSVRRSKSSGKISVACEFCRGED
jgi:hypothetical protein